MQQHFMAYSVKILYIYNIVLNRNLAETTQTPNINFILKIKQTFDFAFFNPSNFIYL